MLEGPGVSITRVGGRSSPIVSFIFPFLTWRMFSSRWRERHEICSRRGYKKQEGAAPNVLVSLNRRAGVNHQNGAGMVPELCRFEEAGMPLTDWNHWGVAVSQLFSRRVV